MNWPTPQDYNEAIQNPHLNFADEELQSGKVETNALGLPQASTGAFASVYKLHCATRNVAVRCFLQSVQDQQQRYHALAQKLATIENDDIFVNFEYIEKGIRVHGTWHPIVKMEWAQGQTLDVYVRKNKEQREDLLQISKEFAQLCKRLQEHGIAHGDLQHGNILVHEGKLKLIDYDGVFLPELAALGSQELGHPNYQHPGRGSVLYDNTIDNFSSWVIHQSLIAVAHAPELLTRLRGCEECLLLRHIDYANPAKSAAFHILEQDANEQVRQCGRLLRSVCSMAPDSIPELGASELPAPVPLSDEVSFNELLSLVESSDDGGYDVDSERAGLSSYLPVDDSWPTVKQYGNAIRSPVRSFSDEELTGASPLKRGQSFWRQLGRESVVFALQTSRRRYAIKCFLADDPTRAERYLKLESYIKNKMPWQLRKYFVEFEYLREGIKIEGKWYPIVKMEWIPGTRIDSYIATTPHSKYVSSILLQLWREMISDFERAGISHGNLEPSNIVLYDGRLKILDYDTMFVPGMEADRYQPHSMSCAELTHPHASKTINAHSDRFAAWLIDTALLAWVQDPALFEILQNRPGRMLFHASDLEHPEQSKLFALLFHNKRPELHLRSKLLFRFLHTQVHEIPPLQAQAMSLLPANLIAEYKEQKRIVSGHVAAVVFSAISIMVLIALPQGGFMSIVPATALVMTVRNILKERRNELENRQ